jgi:hypothetical protein
MSARSWSLGAFRNHATNLFGTGIIENVFLNVVLFDVLEVSSHFVLEELLSVANMNFPGRLTSDLVDCNWDPADIAMWTGSSWGSAVAIPSLEVWRFDILCHLGGKLTLEPITHAGKAMA